MKIIKQQGEKIWEPKKDRVQSSNMYDFFQKANKHHENNITDWNDLYLWSITHTKEFWKFTSEYVNMKWITKGQHIYSPPEEGKLTGAQWFKDHTLNFCENLIPKSSDQIIITEYIENSAPKTITAKKLRIKVACLTKWLKNFGLQKGDIVTGITTNSIDAIIYMLATTACGGVWSSCSPDFGEKSIINRLGQIQPKIIFAQTNYSYKGEHYDCTNTLSNSIGQLTLLKALVLNGKNHLPIKFKKIYYFDEIMENLRPHQEITFEPLNFNEPLYILFSSGTTGKPKCIVHSVGGTLLQHKKELILHTDLKANDKLLFYTTTGWMMWNWMVSALSVKSKLILYGSCPSYPNTYFLWDLCKKENLSVLGLSPAYIRNCMKSSAKPQLGSIPKLKTILSTGSPLLASQYNWIYSNIKKDVQLSSISGGSDIISCFALGNPIKPVYVSEIQSIGLGMSVQSRSKTGEILKEGVKGELICDKPFVSMPLYFLNDPEKSKYQQSYFINYEKIGEVWRHGDFIELTKNQGLIIHGRSDATLNPGGVRIGTAEIYCSLENIWFIKDCVATAKKTSNGDDWIILYIVTKDSIKLDLSYKNIINETLKKDLNKRYVPRHIIQVSKIPYTTNGKKLEIAVSNLINNFKNTNFSYSLDKDLIKEYLSISKFLL